jgi:4-hydroxy-3-methylbut-2-en-1-yl diphosphate reductase
MKIEIERSSGFCFGVVNAIHIAEDSLTKEKELFSLGDIVHNEQEIKRLEKLGLKTITRDAFFRKTNGTVLIRAHGEPTETYQHAAENNITLIDATCPVVLRLQKKIKKAFEQNKKQNGQIVIFGKKGHAEVIGLNGQTGYQAIIVQDESDLAQIDFSRPVTLFSQTTRPVDELIQLAQNIERRMHENIPLTFHNTICSQVASRIPKLKKFADKHDRIIFVAGKKSSNGKSLYAVCKQQNPHSYFISKPEELQPEWFQQVESVGICGATSTPQWLMEKVAETIRQSF